MNTSVLLHLHPQGAFLARAIDYCRVKDIKANIYPCFYPSFMDAFNEVFAKQLKEDIDRLKKKKQSLLCDKYLHDAQRWDSKKKERHEIVDKPNIYEEVKSASIIDTISRNLVMPSMKYFEAADRDKASMEGILSHLHDNIYDSFVRLILKSDARLIVLSHINYVYYTAPLLAAQATGIDTLLLHGGYNETILIKQRQQATYSPAKLRKEAFNTLTKHQLRELGKDKRTHDKVFENAKSIVDTSSALKEKQSSKQIDPNKRLIIVNHQIISEIAYKFPDYAWSKKTSNRYELLEFILKSIDEKAKGSQVIVRIHPDSVRYPGEIEITQRLLSTIQTKNINISIHQPTEANLIGDIVNKTNLYPEIFTLGGNATCELIGKGIKAISVSECYLPKSCEKFELKGPHEFMEYLENPLTLNNVQISEEQMQDCKYFINLFKRAGLRLSNYCDSLNQTDNYFHFNKRDRMYDINKVIDDSMLIGITSKSKVIENSEGDIEVHLHKLKSEI